MQRACLMSFMSLLLGTQLLHMSAVSGLQKRLFEKELYRIENKVQGSWHFCFSEVAVMEKKSGAITFSMPLYKLCHQEKTYTSQ